MAFRETSNFDAPIPGQSLTVELGSRPWQTPPEMSTFEEGLDFYISRIVDPKMAAQLLDIIETVHPRDAELMLGMINKKGIKGVTKKVVEEAFPNLIVSK